MTEKSKSQLEYIASYKKKHYDTISFNAPIGTSAEISAIAKRLGMTKAGFILSSVREYDANH